jgi:hypothetical protein
MSPLICACCWGNMSMVSFLLNHGADPSKSHRNALLRAGHFFLIENPSIWISYFYQEKGNELYLQEETKLLQSAFSITERVDSKCRCSPEGFSPTTSTFKAGNKSGFYMQRQTFEQFLRLLNFSEADTREQWRCFVRMEIFHRLELTHTCIRQFPKVRTFPEEDRLEIEEEEEELYHKLEALMNEYDNWQTHFDGDILNCVDTFFDKLDQDLRPRIHVGLYYGDVSYKLDVLGTGTVKKNIWGNSRGKLIYEHKEGFQESNMLQILFG